MIFILFQPDGDREKVLISPSSVKVPSLGPWEPPTSKSPSLYVPPDINSKFFFPIIVVLLIDLAQVLCLYKFYIYVIYIIYSYQKYY